jgi:hypothetical protein
MSAMGGSIHQWKRAVQLRRNIVGFVTKLDQRSDGQDRLLGGLASLIGQLDAATAGDMLFHVAQLFQRQGREDLAAEVLHALIRDGPTHRLSEAALVDLAQYYTSAEIAWRRRGRVEVSVGRAGDPGATEIGSPAPRAHDGQPGSSAPHRTDPTSDEARVSTTRGSAVFQRRWARTVAVEKRIRGTRPELYAHPGIRLCLLSAYRAHGRAEEARKYYPSLLSSAPAGSTWRDCVRGEIWLDHRRDRPPKPALTCPVAGQRPRLDGVLDDQIWQSDQRAVLQSSLGRDAPRPALVWLARDQQFLYLAARCPKAPGAVYPEVHGVRPRDPALRPHDHVDLWFDVNRDYASYWRLSFDHRGWTGESCQSDSTWNPRWYVAAAADENHWRVEAAIPLVELVGRPPTTGEVWAIGMRRLIPGVDCQSWTQPASVDTVRPERFGYLIFD